MTKDDALAILRASLRKAKRFGQLCEVDERTMQEAIAALSSPCACEGRKVIDIDYEAVLWHDYDDLYHLDANLSKHLPSLLPRQKVKVHVILLADEPQGGAR